jgi:hypothetical protein
MFINGVLIDLYSQQWKAYTADLQGFPPPKIEEAQQIIKDTIDTVPAIIQVKNPQQGEKGLF